MHSRVFEISTEPIAEEDRLTSDGLSDGFFSSVADYAVDSDNREEDIKWFFECAHDVIVPNEDKSGFRLVPGAKEAYFKNAFQQFKECLAVLSTATLGAFAGTENGPLSDSMDMWMYKLKSAYSDKFSFYIYSDGEMFPMDDWMRHADLNESYFFGGVCDYHF